MQNVLGNFMGRLLMAPYFIASKRARVTWVGRGSARDELDE